MTEEVKVTPVGNDKVRLTKDTPKPAAPVAKPAAKPAAPVAAKAPPKVVMGDRAEVEKFVAKAPPKVEVKTEEPKLPASVLAEQAAGRAALRKNVKS